MSEDDNLPRWTGRPGFYEVWFVTMTDPASGLGFWIRSTLHAPKHGPAWAGVWFARFDPVDPDKTFGINRRYGMEAVTVPADAFDVSIDGTRIASGAAVGSLEGDGHAARWDVTFDTGGPTYRMLPDLMYRGSFAPTKPLSPNVEAHVAGRLEVDGEEIVLPGVPGQQGHLYGASHAERWAWMHCSDFVDEEAVVHALTAQGRRAGRTMPFLTSVGVKWQGRWIRLSKWSLRRDFGLGSWHLDVGNRRYRLAGRVEAPARALLRARYEDPDGSSRYCHNSEVASSRVALFERRAGGFEEVALLESRGTTHAEWAGRTPAPAVEREHVEVTG
jgi:tocopherol cyclase-like protein